MVIGHCTIALRAESLSGPIFSRRSKETLLSGYYTITRQNELDHSLLTVNITEKFQAFTISLV